MSPDDESNRCSVPGRIDHNFSSFSPVYVVTGQRGERRSLEALCAVFSLPYMSVQELPMTERMLGNLALWLGCIFFCGRPAPAQEGLKAIENPGGGRILYGRVAGQTTAAGAMGEVLRSIHGEYGAAPQPGGPFRVRGTDSVAAYFTVARSVPDEGPLAGLIVASASAPGHVEVGVVYDAAARFASTIDPLLTALFQSWRPSLGDAPRCARFWRLLPWTGSLCSAIEDIVRVPGDTWNKAADAVVASRSALFEFVDPSGSIER